MGRVQKGDKVVYNGPDPRKFKARPPTSWLRKGKTYVVGHEVSLYGVYRDLLDPRTGDWLGTSHEKHLEKVL